MAQDPETFELKPLGKQGVRAALEKARQYRLLNEPSEAESICLDIMRVEPGNQEALRTLLLVLTDKFEHGTVAAVRPARDLLERFEDEYSKLFYEGIICERWAKAVLKHHRPRYQFTTYEWLRNAMDAYEAAAKIHPPGNEDAILRFNTCVRILKSNPSLGPEPEGMHQPQMLE